MDKTTSTQGSIADYCCAICGKSLADKNISFDDSEICCSCELRRFKAKYNLKFEVSQ